MSKNIFKFANQNQSYLIPPTWDEKIHKNHPVRIINNIIDKLNLDDLIKSYQGGGSSSYHPKMLLKAIIYCYLNNIYSSRKIEQAIRSDIHLIWLCSNQEPDHNTINRFRTQKLENNIDQVFKQIVLLLVEEGVVSLKQVYVDGTKIEANANKYSFVWGKSVRRNKEKIVKILEEIWTYANSLAKEELQNNEVINFKEITSNQVTELVNKLDSILKDKEISPEIKKKLDYSKKKYVNKFAEYEQKLAILEERNSYSKSDNDATFMRMKDDVMQNGQLKAGYNVQISTNQQYIVNYGIFQNPSDSTTLPKHLDEFERKYNQVPELVCTDAGYGSEENYQHAENKGIKAIYKYNYFHQEQRGIRQKKYPFDSQFLYYNQKEDYFVCPMGQHMERIRTYTKKNANNYLQEIAVYQAVNCRNCPLRARCYSSKNDQRIIEINHNARRLKMEAKENLISEEGIYHRKQRPHQVEAAFGNIKYNKHFTRFTLRGKSKVHIEFGLVAIAHNLQKMLIKAA